MNRKYPMSLILINRFVDRWIYLSHTTHGSGETRRHIVENRIVLCKYHAKLDLESNL